MLKSQVILAGMVGLLISAPVMGAEYRALWIDTWNPGILDVPSTQLTVERARQHNFNTLFVEVCKTMDAHHNSALLPRSQNLAPDYDPLAGVLHFAKSKNPKVRPLEVHAWVVALRAWKDKPFPPDTGKPRHVLNSHPEWLSKTVTGEGVDTEKNRFLDPGHPAVQDFLVAVCKEVVNNYPVDGLHLDYIRYPGPEWGYNPVALERFQKETGRKDVPAPKDEQWCAWRREQVTALVKRISAEIHAIRPTIELSAATITWGGIPDKDFTKTKAYQDALQDWVGWIRNGYIDISVPMNYKRANNPNQAQDYVDWVSLARATNTERHVIIGLGAWMNPLDATTRQASVARRMRADGIALFSYNQLDSSKREQAPLMREISGRLFKGVSSTPTPNWLRAPSEGIAAGSDPHHRSGYPVLLLDSKKREIARTKTDANGHFYFFGVQPGLYTTKVGLASIYSEPLRVSAGKVNRARF